MSVSQTEAFVSVDGFKVSRYDPYVPDRLLGSSVDVLVGQTSAQPWHDLEPSEACYGFWRVKPHYGIDIQPRLVGGWSDGDMVECPAETETTVPICQCQPHLETDNPEAYADFVPDPSYAFAGAISRVSVFARGLSLVECRMHAEQPTVDGVGWKGLPPVVLVPASSGGFNHRS